LDCTSASSAAKKSTRPTTAPDPGRPAAAAGNCVIAGVQLIAFIQ
jgi:hypothetical protein